MDRRDFLARSAAAGVAGALWSTPSRAEHAVACGPGFASPADAVQAPREKVLYTVAIYAGTPVEKPDYLATIDADPRSTTYGQVVHRLPMPYVGDELHHFGWNTCSSCHGDQHRERRFLVIPGFRSGRIYIVDTNETRAPQMHQVIEAEEIQKKTDLSAPHTVHCLASGEIMISMLGDSAGRAPGGFLLLDEEFNVAGRWERDTSTMQLNYDFWYQPRHNVMISSEFAAPNTYHPGFNAEDVAAGRYGQRLHFWNWTRRELTKTVDLGDQGRIPLEVRFFHDPESSHGYVGAALSSTIWHWQRKGDDWQVDRVIGVPPEKVDGAADPIPALITDILISMDDRYLYFSNWLHGDVRQYDIGNPDEPKLVGQVFCGGLLGKVTEVAGRPAAGGPQMLQLSLDGKRLYVTSSLYSSWDNQFYPQMAEQGSYLLRIDCDTEQGGLSLADDFCVDFGQEPEGPARAHEIRYPGGDCTSDIFV